MLTTSCPRQRNQTLLKHCTLFKDFIQLRACISDIDSSLDLSTEIDVFIKGTKHLDFLNR